MPFATPQSSPRSEEVPVFEAPAEDKPQVQPKPAEKKPESLPTLPSQNTTEIRKKPAGAVSLFGGIDVLNSKQTKGPLDYEDQDDIFLSKGSPPPMFSTGEKKEEKGQTKTVSLFDEDEEDESEWNDPIFMASKSMGGKTSKVCLLCTRPQNAVKIDSFAFLCSFCI
ncbi:hypothetical protein GOODEAATRI_018150 [Goodea atripinnis]|uniref:Uncharacterized protein n=1 Tax=Goodea atripinnis TaxID=208336 RepID=A0ABV0NBJ8_9TELE